jgi:hypothetical protein
MITIVWPCKLGELGPATNNNFLDRIFIIFSIPIFGKIKENNNKIIFKNKIENREKIMSGNDLD